MPTDHTNEINQREWKMKEDEAQGSEDHHKDTDNKAAKTDIKWNEMVTAEKKNADK